MNMLELHQNLVRHTFNDFVTIGELCEMTTPRLAERTVSNAILMNKIVAKKFGGEAGEKGGVWLVYLPSAMQKWESRFKTSFQKESSTK